MTGAEFKKMREALLLTAFDLGHALGYDGSRNTIQVQIQRFESDARPIPPAIERLMLMFERYGVPSEFTQAGD